MYEEMEKGVVLADASEARGIADGCVRHAYLHSQATSASEPADARKRHPQTVEDVFIQRMCLYKCRNTVQTPCIAGGN
jgi:hypothetical protein